MNVIPLQQPDPEPVPAWDDFWTIYPRHEARKDAFKAWGQMTDDAERLAAIIGAAAWRRILLARHAEGFCPLPASWLRGERYRDELPAQVTVSSSAHVPFAAGGALPPRTGLPASVVAMLAKLRGKP